MKRKINPTDKKGKVTRCIICDPKMHWAKTCPNKSNTNVVNITESDNDDSPDEEVHIVLMANNEYEILLNEMETNAIIDTACTKTVSGEKWFFNYMNCLDDTAINLIEIKPGRKVFKFGYGRKVYSKYQAIIPAKIGSKECFIQTEIVDEKIPLLLSKTSLKKADTYLNIKNDKIKMFDKDIDVCVSTNGHYAVNILPEKVGNFDSVDHYLIFEIDDNNNTKRSKILKLHKHSGHASSNNLKNLLKNAGLLTIEISKVLDEISKNCVICKTHKKPSPRPVVSLARATKFSQTVAIELHSLDRNIWYFHMIDEFTRFSNATIIKSKHPEIIIKNFLQNWVSLFGTPFKVFSDSGGEFFSREFIDFCENFNIKVQLNRHGRMEFVKGIMPF